MIENYKLSNGKNKALMCLETDLLGLNDKFKISIDTCKSPFGIDQFYFYCKAIFAGEAGLKNTAVKLNFIVNNKLKLKKIWEITICVIGKCFV